MIDADTLNIFLETYMFISAWLTKHIWQADFLGEIKMENYVMISPNI